ncbi:MAG: hypothetical protein ACI4IT_05375 [Oscillospiraceae bacterium]
MKQVLTFPVITGHTNDSYFTNDFLFFSTAAFARNTNDSNFDGNNRYLYKIDLSNETMEIIKDFGYTGSLPFFLTFIDDYDGNLYYITMETENTNTKYTYEIHAIDQSGNLLSSDTFFTIENSDSNLINRVANDSSGNWYVSTYDKILMLDSNYNFIKVMDLPCSGNITNIFRSQNGALAIVLKSDICKLYTFDSKASKFCEYAVLPNDVNDVFRGNSNYNFVYSVYDATYSMYLYGLKSSSSPELLISGNDYGLYDIGILNLHIDQNDNIFILKNGNYYSKSPTSEIIVFKNLKNQ